MRIDICMAVPEYWDLNNVGPWAPRSAPVGSPLPGGKVGTRKVGEDFMCDEIGVVGGYYSFGLHG